MANPIETTLDYMGSVVPRAIGISTWRKAEAMRRPKSETSETSETVDKTSVYPTRLDSMLEAMLVVLTPALSRFYTSNIISRVITDERNSGIIDAHLKAAGLLIPTMAIDMAALTSLFSLGHSPWEVVALKLAANAATHVGLDMASVAGKGATRVFRHFRPPTGPL